MFWIAYGEAESPAVAPVADDSDQLSQFCVTDGWSANLSDAMLRLGSTAAEFHNLDPDRRHYGLLEFVRCYDADLQRPIVNILEKAALTRQPFHFSATLPSRNGSRHCVYCFGAHRDGSMSTGELFGTFLFSKSAFERIR